MYYLKMTETLVCDDHRLTIKSIFEIWTGPGPELDNFYIHFFNHMFCETVR